MIRHPSSPILHPSRRYWPWVVLFWSFFPSLSSFLVPAATPGAEGVIAGTVVNASRGRRPADGAQVILQLRTEGQFAPFRETVADSRGEFCFKGLPVGVDYLYLVGANRDGVYHPGPRLQILMHRPDARVELKVYDGIASPNPLVIRRQEILLSPEPGVLRVTESLLVENPTETCFVGESPAEGSEPVTLRLAIPSEFERTTFQEEFYGRRFSLAAGTLVTGIPWPPGQRELKFTYVLRNEKKYYRWQRPLDLPCEQLRIRVRTAAPEQVSCNLPPGNRRTDLKSVPQGATDLKSLAPNGEVVFESAGNVLPAGHILRVDLGALPLPLMAYARWIAVALLVLLVAAVSRLAIRRNPSCTFAPRSR